MSQSNWLCCSCSDLDSVKVGTFFVNIFSFIFFPSTENVPVSLIEKSAGAFLSMEELSTENIPTFIEHRPSGSTATGVRTDILDLFLTENIFFQ